MNLATNSKLNIIITLLLHLISKSTSSPTYIYSVCSNTTKFATNSKYHTNLNTLFKSLSSNATTNPTGFDITSAGTNRNDTVYGLFLCRGDQNITACSDCVKTATTTDLPKSYCPNRKVAVIWYDECMLRYSNESLLGKVEQSPSVYLTNTQNMIGNQTAFFDLLESTMHSLAAQTWNSKSGKKYATKVAKISILKTLYAMEQCTPDLSASDCNQCLTFAIGSIEIKMGARVLQPSCFIRYETYPFYDGATNFSGTPPLPSPSLSPGTKPVVNNGNGHRKLSGKIIAAIVAPVTVILLVVLALGICFIRKRSKKYGGLPPQIAEVSEIKKVVVDSLQYDLNTIRIATNNFAADNKLGEGGFGEVYKGKIENGQEIAVKRLSKNSGQGVVEFKTEVDVVAKLRHKNLVELLGFCVELEEKILVYEFLPNSSLDRFLFDQTKNVSLDWQTRFKIIIGIAKGLLYLHEDSPLKIIHRDLKSSNILLDEDMNPKISDFGLAKLFGVDQTQGDTKRIVGTYGYMAPEYAITGHYSVKSDVFSFGVLVLEIVSGQRNRFFGRLQLEEALLHRAWRLWNEEKTFDLVDTTLDNFPIDEVTKCIHIGLLCVQEEAIVRPRMASIVAALNGQAIILPVPKPPHFFGTNNNVEDNEMQYNFQEVYTGTASITELYPRD